MFSIVFFFAQVYNRSVFVEISMNRKNIIIITAAVVVAAGAWATSSFLFAPTAPEVFEKNEEVPASESELSETAATSTDETAGAAATMPVTAAIPQPQKAPARIMLDRTLFNYDIVRGATPCGDRIGTVAVTSDDPSKELYWGMTGAMPIWLGFSAVEGKTPATIDMTFNCIMSGAEENIDWEFVVVEKTEDGKYVDGYHRSFKIVGDIK